MLVCRLSVWKLRTELITRKMTRKRCFDAFCLLLCVVVQGHLFKGKNLYISRASGNDSWSCDQKEPCETIWRAVTLASRGDYIHLDGTSTEKDPYTCQSMTSKHPGIHINKSLSLIGFGPMPPRIRCSEGTSLTFDGSDSAQQMDITLSGLFLNESFVYFQDSSVKIHSCRFEGSKRGVQFLISTRMVSNIKITNSSFVGNDECISVTVNSKKKLSHQKIQVIFKLKTSSFYGNTMSDKGSFISFSESPDNNQSVSCNITLENVTFSQNKFSSRGLVFLELKNGTQNINLKQVTFVNNGPKTDQGVLTGHGHSEFFLRSTIVNTFVNASNFIGQNARSFDISAAHIALQIYNTSFGGHNVQGNGGVILLRGTDLCKVNVSNSSFVNTSAAQGGALDIECMEVRFSLQGSIFSRNAATLSGGAVMINGHGATVRTNGNVSSSEQEGGTLDVNSILQTKKLLDGVILLIVERCSFIGCRSGEAGTLFVANDNNLQIAIKDSHFISNYGLFAAALFAGPFGTEDSLRRNSCNTTSQITIENSTFSKNEAELYGGVLNLVGNNNHSIITLNKVILDFNIAQAGGAAFIGAFCTMKIFQSQILNNKGVEGTGVTLLNVKILEVVDSIFEGNHYLGMTEGGLAGGAITFFSNLPHFTSDHSVLIVNTTFNNCSAQHGGAIHFNIDTADVRVRLTINNSRFTKNLAVDGGAIWFSVTQDTQGDLKCIKPNERLKMEDIDAMEKINEPSWDHKGHLVIENTRFDENAAEVGGAAYLTNGNVTFSNCYFVDNFASSFGSHIYTMESSTSLQIQDSRFLQTNLTATNSLNINHSFINVESEGPVVLHNTTLDSWPYSDKVTLFLVSNSRLIFIGKDNLTKFNCPLGSNLTMTYFTTNTTKRINKTCKVKIITRYTRFDCLACTGNTYSLQRGRAIEGQIVPGYECLPCPFGGNCTQNIVAKRNFWGFEEQENPPTLRFTICPVGYCVPPQKSSFPEYNGCQGNRSGDLCGHCNDSYTETLYSTHCKPSHLCNDNWFWSVALAYVSLMALYFTFKPPVVPWIKRQILWFKENKPEDQENIFDKGYLKILFYFYQATNLLLVSVSSQYLIKTNLIEPIVGLFNFKVLSSRLICPFPGLTVVTKQIFSASHVFGILLMICAFYFLHLGIQKIRSQGVPSAGPYIGGILQTLLLGYTTLATVSFSLLRCVPIGSELRLFYDGNIVCFQWWQYIFISFVCTFVVPFVFVLLWGSFKLYGGTLSVEKFLLACFFPLPSLFYWLYVWFSHVIGYSVSVHPSSWQVSKDSVERVLYDSFKRPEDGSKLSLSWESIMIGRRLILVMLNTFVSDPLTRLLVMNLFCVMFLLHHVLAQPFRDRVANIIETISLLSIVVLATGNVFFSSFLSLAVPANEDHFSSSLKFFHGMEMAILCFAPFIFGLFVVTAILSQLFRLAFWVCRVACNVCSRCFRSCYNNEDDEAKPLLVPGT